ncbi:MAG TPA: FeoB-associated Cys-rich membrane protein [Pyrinomonadaceae bacterium]|jgi:hypothetical protein|nr:FeoB-associated Cys-rich membrane protein [Pyrinomonadaceae bacterium]
MLQYLIVTLIILSAVFYVGLNVWRKVAGKKGAKGGCETGCGKCGD